MSEQSSYARLRVRNDAYFRGQPSESVFVRDITISDAFARVIAAVVTVKRLETRETATRGRDDQGRERNGGS
jgi:hypothetical protein